MKKEILALFFLLIVCFTGSSQDKAIFIRHDSVLLNASECNWLIPPDMKTNPNLYPGSESTIAEWLLASIHKGKIKARDHVTGQIIPGKEIYTWRMPIDTVQAYNENLELSGYKVIKQERQAKYLTQIRVLLDWYMDSNGKFYSRLRGIDLMEETRTYDGRFFAYRPLCRISY